MQEISQNLQSIYHNYKLIPLCLCIAVLTDYLLTFHFAGSTELILKYEFSPTLRFAVEHGIVVPYMGAMVLFYYAAGYFVLRLLIDSEIYFVGVAVVLLISITHVLGGLSWYVQNPWYSNSVISLSMISVLTTLLAFGYEVLKKAN
ncbi:TPA: hypothetical protein HA338_17165 [Methanosarcina acetivorans]|uniref:Uncharacterized protein n=1 Tax=Methanosarcina acetivorans TaxID=2214 RepID=A0A832WA48_9EURY|nr:hypothetical protein [Methanosarcina acetivorans]HIH95658.1 hypothetical protein [Methanosarcina acetivorans]